jgi:ubiquinone/menaquinone biosynthesis C-methylase UbiE
MKREIQSSSPKPEAISEHYASGYEANRLNIGQGFIDRERSRELLRRFLPPVPAVVLDIGGGPGAHACWLSELGYEVHLIDIVPLHVELARKASDRQPHAPLSSAEVGDARSLTWADCSVDAVMMFGPLYHLTDKRDRLTALSEAYRVLKPGGSILAVGISRFASALDGLRSGFLEDPSFVEIVFEDLESGRHRNPTDHPEYFMETFFHHPDELQGELSEAGFNVKGVFGVEGPSWLTPNLDKWLEDKNLREALLGIARKLETEKSMLGISAHLIAVAKK